MFQFGFTRVMEPTPGSLILAADCDDDATEDPFALTLDEACHPESAAKVAVWESVLSWMQGNGPVASAGTQGAAVADVEKLDKIVHTSKSETERVGM